MKLDETNMQAMRDTRTILTDLLTEIGAAIDSLGRTESVASSS